VIYKGRLAISDRGPAFTIMKNGSSAPKGGTPEGSEVDLLFSF
jgi:hypothetical protein